jgi:DNA-binding NtrC family response regulator
MRRSSQILIVDDEPNVRLMFRTALTSEGYTLSVAEDGEAALRAQLATPADLMLLDLQMPGLDGLAVLRALRDREDDVAVVMITAHGSVPHAVEAMKLGAIDFLSKPITPEVLRKTVASVLARHEIEVVPAPKNEPITPTYQAAANLAKAKKAINLRHFDEAEVYLKQAIALVADSAESHNLMGVIHELRNEHDASYRSYRAALKVDKTYEPAKHNMLRYYERFTFGRSEVPVDTGV